MALQQWNPAAAAWVEADGKLTVTAQKWLRDLYLRAGGTDTTTLDTLTLEVHNLEHAHLSARHPTERPVDDAQPIIANQVFGP